LIPGLAEVGVCICRVITRQTGRMHCEEKKLKTIGGSGMEWLPPEHDDVKSATCPFLPLFFRFLAVFGPSTVISRNGSPRFWRTPGQLEAQLAPWRIRHNVNGGQSTVAYKRWDYATGFPALC
jgi:hypothetical protein